MRAVPPSCAASPGEVHMLVHLALVAMPSCLNAADDLMPVRPAMPTDQKQIWGCSSSQELAAYSPCRQPASDAAAGATDCSSTGSRASGSGAPRWWYSRRVRDCWCSGRRWRRGNCSVSRGRKGSHAARDSRSRCVGRIWSRHGRGPSHKLRCISHVQKPRPFSRWRNAGALSVLQCSHADLSISMGTAPVLGG